MQPDRSMLTRTLASNSHVARKAALLIPGQDIALIFVLVPGIILRMLYIDQPFVDAWSWREADMATIARNFYRNGFNVFYPQINWAGSDPGYVGTEFQLVSLLASAMYVPFGIHE